MIQVFKPSMGDEEIEALAEVIQSGWIGLGPKVAEFEANFATYVGAKYAVALNSCTAALDLALKVLEIKEGDEVIVPTITFVSTAHCIVYNGATPIFCDVEPDTLCISINDVKRKITSKTVAILPVHYGGHPCAMDEISAIAKRYNLIVIEDAAHACGAEYQLKNKEWVKIGSCVHSDIACFSFHAVKNLATGDGGMITTNKLEIADRLKRLRWLGIDKDTWKRAERGITSTLNKISYDWYYEVSELGYKCHMNDITAAIGLVQLRKLDKMNARRREIVNHYNEAFKGIEWIEPPVEKSYARSACHNYVIKTPYRDELNLYLKDKSIATGVHYMPLHIQPYYREQYKGVSFPIANTVWKKLLTLPLYPDLKEDEITYIIQSIKDFKIRATSVDKP